MIRLERRIIAALLLLATALPGPSRPALAARSDCPWLIQKYFTQEVLKVTDPTDLKALTDILQTVFEKPGKALGAAEREWVQRYDLKPVVDQVREQGLQNQRVLRRQKYGVAGAKAGAAALVATAIGQHFVRRFLESLDLEGWLNSSYGLSLQGNSRDELRFLEKTIECDPEHGLTPKTVEGILGPVAREKNALELANALLIDWGFQDREMTAPLPGAGKWGGAPAEELAPTRKNWPKPPPKAPIPPEAPAKPREPAPRKSRYLSQWDREDYESRRYEYDRALANLPKRQRAYLDQQRQYERDLQAWDDERLKPIRQVFDLWRRTGIPLCTRWNSRSRYGFSPTDVDFLHDLFAEKFPPSISDSLIGLRGIVRVSPKFQPASNHMPDQVLVLGHYVPAVHHLELYIEQMRNGRVDPDLQHTIIHELGHAVSQELKIGVSPRWRALSWGYHLKDGYYPRDDVWWPWAKPGEPVYARKDPEENWAESFSCYFDERCGSEMKSRHPAMYDYVAEQIQAVDPARKDRKGR